MKVNGIRTKCMGEVCIVGRMAENIRESTKKIRSKAMVNITMLMGAYTLEGGPMASKMELALYYYLIELLQKEGGQRGRKWKILKSLKLIDRDASKAFNSKKEHQTKIYNKQMG